MSECRHPFCWRRALARAYLLGCKRPIICAGKSPRRARLPAPFPPRKCHLIMYTLLMPETFLVQTLGIRLVPFVCLPFMVLSPVAALLHPRVFPVLFSLPFIFSLPPAAHASPTLEGGIHRDPTPSGVQGTFLGPVRHRSVVDSKERSQLVTRVGKYRCPTSSRCRRQNASPRCLDRAGYGE